jgi:hypothetical protein
MNPFDPDKRFQEIQSMDMSALVNPLTPVDKQKCIDLNAINVDLNQVVYRTLPFARLKDFVKNKRFSLSRPVRFDDPFENFLLKAVAVLPTGEKVSTRSMRDSYYVQCWTEKEECDGLWRSFRGNKVTGCDRECVYKRSVRIKSTVQKLMDAFYDVTNTDHFVSYFVGKVNYLDTSAIRNFLATIRIGNNYKPDLFVQGLLIKRKQFQYEDEVRLIFKKPQRCPERAVKNKWDNSDFFYYTIDPNKVIDEVTVEPWAKKEAQVDIKRELRSVGYNGPVNRSNLYDQLSATVTV